MQVYTPTSKIHYNTYIGLGEHKIRDLNDEINKLIREKGHWEDRIKELGGADYKKYGPKVLDSQGMELPGKLSNIIGELI